MEMILKLTAEELAVLILALSRQPEPKQEETRVIIDPPTTTQPNTQIIM